MIPLLRRNKIVLLGDSITQMSFSAKLSGWGAHLADHYQRRCDVYNRGMSGYNTDWYLKYLQTKVGRNDVFDGMMNKTNKVDNSSESSQHDVKLVTIFFGANDASCQNLNPRHHVPLDRFQSNLEKLVQLCRENFGEDIRIVFITPPPVHHSSRLRYQVERYGENASGELERTLDLASKYADAVVEVARNLGYPHLNIFKLMLDAVPGEGEGWSKFLSDGLHLSSEGNMFLGEHLIDLIDKEYPEMTVVPCPDTGYTGNSASKGAAALKSEKGIGPWHDEIDHLNPSVAFSQS
jgi:Lysophospholipase L1 and related esterases